MSADLIVVDSPLGLLALTPDQVRAALAAAAEVRASIAPAALSPSTSATRDERWLTAAECEAATGVPKSWFAEGARRGTIPCKRAGHYVRFRLSELDEALRKRPNDGRSTRNERVPGAKSLKEHAVVRLRPSRVANPSQTDAGGEVRVTR